MISLEFRITCVCFGAGNKSEIYLHWTFNLMHLHFIFYYEHCDWLIAISCGTCARTYFNILHITFYEQTCRSICVGMINYWTESVWFQIIACIYVDFGVCVIQRGKRDGKDYGGTLRVCVCCRMSFTCYLKTRNRDIWCLAFVLQHGHIPFIIWMMHEIKTI